MFFVAAQESITITSDANNKRKKKKQREKNDENLHPAITIT